MSATQAQKEARKRWNAANIKKVSVNLRREKAEAFAERCKALGISQHAVLLSAIERFMAETGAEERSEK